MSDCALPSIDLWPSISNEILSQFGPESMISVNSLSRLGSTRYQHKQQLQNGWARERAPVSDMLPHHQILIHNSFWIMQVKDDKRKLCLICRSSAALVFQVAQRMISIILWRHLQACGSWCQTPIHSKHRYTEIWCCQTHGQHGTIDFLAAPDFRNFTCSWNS